MIELKAENLIFKNLLNAILSKSNPNEVFLIDNLDKIPKELIQGFKLSATRSITDELKIISNDFDDLIRNLLNP